MIQNAVVKKLIDSRTAEITVLRETACDGCRSSCSGCSSGKIITALADNKIAAAPGDRVIVSSSTGKVLKTAAFVYLLPLLTFFTGYAVSGMFSASENASVVISLFSFFFGVFAVWTIGRRKNKTYKIACEIKEIIK